MPRKFIDEILSDSPKYTLRDNDGDVLNDNVDIALKTPVVQEGTPLNKIFFDELFTYEELEYEKIDHSYLENLTRGIRFELDEFTDGASTVTGSALIGKFYDGNPTETLTQTMEMYTSASSGFNLSTSSGSTTMVAVSAYINGTEKATMDDINTILKRTSYNSSYYLNLAGSASKRFTFDLKTAKKATFNIRFDSTYAGETGTLSGSNDGSSFTTISSISKDTAVSVTSDTAYRYYRFSVDGTAGVHEIYYMYLTADDTRKILSYENSLTTQSELIINKEIIVRTPDALDMANVTTNTLNGIEIDGVLISGERYRLLYNGENILKITDTKIVAGYATAVNDIVTVELGFKPKLVICYNSYNHSLSWNASTGTASSTAGVISPKIIATPLQTTTARQEAYLTDTGFVLNTNDFACCYIAFN